MPLPSVPSVTMGRNGSECPFNAEKKKRDLNRNVGNDWLNEQYPNRHTDKALYEANETHMAFGDAAGEGTTLRGYHARARGMLGVRDGTV